MFACRRSFFATTTALVFFLSALCAVQSAKVSIGVLFSASGDQAYLGATVRLTSEMWLSMNPTFALGHTPELVYCDVASSLSGTVECFHRLMHTHNISAFTAPESHLAEALAPLTDDAKIPLIASVSGLPSLFLCDEQLLPPCTRPYGRRFQYLISNGPTTDTATVGLLGYLRSFAFGASTVAFVHASDFFNTAVCHSVQNDALNSRFQVVFNATLPDDPFGNLTAAASLDIVSDRLRHIDADVVVWCAAPACREAGEAFAGSHYYPRALVMPQCLQSDYAQSVEGRVNLRYALGGGPWDARLLGNDYRDSTTLPYCNNFVPRNGLQSAQLFSDAFANFTHGRTATFTEAGIYSAFYMIEAAVVSTQSTRGVDIMQAMLSLNLPTFRGRIQIDSDHMISYGANVLTQTTSLVVGTIPDVVFPSSSFTAQLVYPAPTYDERRYTHASFKNGMEVGVAVVGALLALFTVAVMVRLFIVRHAQAVKVMDWKLCMLALVGVMITSLAPLVWTEQSTQIQCDWWLGLWVAGPFAMFSPLLGVFARILVIMWNTYVRATSEATRSRNIFFLVAAQLGFCCGVLVAWRINDPLTLTITVRDPLRPAFDFHECTSTGWSSYGIILLAYFLLLLVLIVIMALAIQGSVRDPRFDRFRSVLVASFICMALVGVILVLQYYASKSQATVPALFLFSLRSILLYMNNTAYVFLLLYTPLRDGFLEQRMAPSFEQTMLSSNPRHQSKRSLPPPAVAAVADASPVALIFPFPRAASSHGDLFLNREDFATSGL